MHLKPRHVCLLAILFPIKMILKQHYKKQYKIKLGAKDKKLSRA